MGFVLTLQMEFLEHDRGPLAEHQDAVGQKQSFIYIMSNEQDGWPVLKQYAGACRLTPDADSSLRSPSD